MLRDIGEGNMSEGESGRSKGGGGRGASVRITSRVRAEARVIGLSGG